MRVKIVKSKPKHGQEGISHLIGLEFEVINRDKDCYGKYTGQVSVDARESNFGGLIVLQKGEYRAL